MSFDAQMIRHAAARLPVRVDAPKPYVAKLVAWRPHRGNGSRPFTARVEFPSGGRLTVDCSIVTPIGETP